MSGKESSFIQSVFRVLICGLLVSAALCVLMGVIWMAADPDSELLGKAELTALLIMVTFGSWVLAALVIRAGRLLVTMLMSAVGTLCGSCLVICIYWLEPHIGKQSTLLMVDIGIPVLLISLTLVHNGALSLPAASGMVRIIRIVTMICTWIFVACVLALIWFGELFDFGLGGYFFILTIIMISLLLAAVGTLVVPLATVGRLSRRKMLEGAMESRLTVSMDCPKCGERQNFAIGAAKCPDCRARLFIEIEEPHCECGYLLYRLVGEVCPECGRPVPPEQRWAVTETAE